MFDYMKTINLIKGGLLDSKNTWQSYLEEDHDCKDTAINLTGPLILGTFILSAILSWIFSSQYMFSRQSGFFALLMGLIGAIVGIIVAAFIFSYLAGVFKGKHDFKKGFAALSLASIPGYLGTVLGTLPMIGWLLSLGLGILSLVFLYKIIPSYLEVPDENRAIHFIASLLATIIFAFILSMVIGFGSTPNYSYTSSGIDVSKDQKVSVGERGMFREIERQATLADEADDDTFDPPADGQISKQQMKTLVANLERVTDFQARQEAQIKKLEEQMDGKEDLSFSDLSKLGRGMGSLISASNAEVEVVKSGGGNWAEHQWVKQQLRVAVIQKDLNKAVEHNYALYQKYEEELTKYGLRL